MSAFSIDCLAPKAANPRPEGGSASVRSTGTKRYPDGIFRLSGDSRAPSPPYLLGGDNCQSPKFDTRDFNGTVGVDWLQGTVSLEHAALLYDYFSEMCGGEPECFTWGRFCYDRHCEWHPYGIAMYWDSDAEKRLMHQNRVTIQLPGQSLNAFDAGALLQLIRDLSAVFEFSATRLDLCFDDYEKIRKPHEVAKVAEQSNFTGFKRWRPEQERRVSGEFLNDGVCFGQRGKNGSGCYLRCYDKHLQSIGKIDAVRWEVELSKEKAKQVFGKLIESADLETFAGLIGSIIGGSIDFIDRQGSHLDRMERLDWWQRICDILGRIKLRNPERIQSVEQTVSWVETSVAASLEKVRQAYGSKRFHDWLHREILGHSLNKKQKAQVRDYHDKHGNPPMVQSALFTAGVVL